MGTSDRHPGVFLEDRREKLKISLGGGREQAMMRNSDSHTPLSGDWKPYHYFRRTNVKWHLWVIFQHLLSPHVMAYGLDYFAHAFRIIFCIALPSYRKKH